jgi:hypothetical protein
MKLADHPNAVWLRSLYVEGAAIKHDLSLSAEERRANFNDHVRSTMSSLAPNFTIHTGGCRLAAAGGLEFMHAYSARRAHLSRGTFRSVEILEIVADDNWACITGRFEASIPTARLDTLGMGVWRFSDRRAVEHWELPDSTAFDDFFLTADPVLDPETAIDYWTRPVPGR